MGRPLGWNQFGELLSLNQLHDDERLIRVGTHLVDGADVGMIQARCMLRFALQPGMGVAAAGNPHLERDISSELEISGGIHLAHAACADPAPHLITAEHQASQ